MDSKDWTPNQPLSSTVDMLSAAVKSNIMPNKEYLLQGSVIDSAVDNLLHRLRGLCDNVDSAPVQFEDHEMCFVISRSPASGGTNNQPLNLRVRRVVDSNEDCPYQLRYVGEPELGAGDKSRPTIVRSSIDVAVTPSILDFLTEMGFRMEYEYIARGYLFRKGRMKITVSKIFKIVGQSQGLKSYDLEIISQSYLVEMSVLAPSNQEAIGDDMKTFAEQLKPLVHLDKIDAKRLIHGPPPVPPNL